MSRPRVCLLAMAGALWAAPGLLAQDRIAPGQALRETVAAGRAARFDLVIDSGEFVRLTVTDSGLHPHILLSAPDGRTLREIRGRSLGWTSLSHVCRESGLHRVRISSGPGPTADFAVELRYLQRRPATADDPARLEAEGLVLEAAELRDQWLKESTAAAIAKAERAIELHREVGDQNDLLWGYRLLADLHYRSSHAGPALEALNQAVRLSSHAGLDDLESELEAFRGLVLVGSSENEPKGDPREACASALERARRQDHEPGMAMAFNCLGEARYYVGDLNGAIEDYLQAERLWSALPPRRETAETALYLAGAYRDVGRVEEAEAMFLEAERLWGLVDDPRGQTLTTIGRGLLAVKKGLYQDALRLLSDGRGASEAAGNDFWRAVSDALLGSVYLRLGEPSIALDYFQNSREGFEAAGALKTQSEIHLEIGRTYRVLAEYEKSLSHFESSSRIAEKTGDRRILAVALLQKGLSLEALGRPDAAEAAFQRALVDLKADEFRSGRAAALNGLGCVRRGRGDLDQAERLHREALELSRAADDGLVESQSLYYLAQVGLARGDLDVSRSLVEAAIQKVEGLRANVDDLSLRASYFATVQDFFGFQIDLLMRLDSTDRQAGWAARALEAAERARARSLLEGLIQGRVEDGVRLVAQPLSLAKIQERLAPETALLEYALGPARSFLWVITRTGLSSSTLPPEDEINAMVRRLHEALTVRASADSREAIVRGDRTADQLLETLAEILLPPEDRIAGLRLVVIPDGTLHHVPFAALKRSVAATSGAPEPRFLVLDHEVVRLPSASALAFLRDRGAARTQPPAKTIAILADPVFEPDDPRLAGRSRGTPPDASRQKPDDLVLTLRDFRFDSRIPRLVSSGFEAREILNLAPPGTGFLATGTRADRSLVLDGGLARYRILHFATHGMNNPDHPDRSGLVLSLLDEAGNARDGFLRLPEICRLKLPVDLVVLSACDTALGREIRGEGVLGLVRAFQYAGAQSVLASLWKVEDRATELLMREFYRAHFGRGLAPGAALRQAQTAMLAKQAWKSPFYWAAFQLEGDSRAPGAPATAGR